MRLGCFVFGDLSTPERWAEAHLAAGYGAAYWPLDEGAADEEVAAYAAEADRAGLVIAEVGAWRNNPLSSDPVERARGRDACARRLELADRVGARCCVNVAGSLGPKWDGPFAADLAEGSFELIVESVRAIIDAVRPKRSFYSLEPMPWMLPDSPESYLELIRAVDRPAFGVHLDPCNMITSPRRCFASGAFLKECFRLLGPWIRSCHAKDVAMSQRFTTHIDEVVAGRGLLDYAVFLSELDRLPGDLPLMLEHLETEAEYLEAAAFVRSVARSKGLRFTDPIPRKGGE